MPTQVYRVNTDAGLRGRTGAGTQYATRKDRNGKLMIRPRGYRLNIVKKKPAGGLVWGRTDKGTWYALKYCKLQGAASGGGGSRPQVKSPAPGYRVSTPYGKKKAGLWLTRGFHTGDDYAAPFGAACVAVVGGQAWRFYDSVLGNVVVIYGDDGASYWYCHLQSYSVRNQQRITAGDTVGRVGDTGTGARGPHLHFEKHSGHSTNWWAPVVRPTW